jgi:hypothetical protein
VPALVIAVGLVLAPLLAPASAHASMPQQSGAVDLLNQANLRIDGAGANDYAGTAVAAAGDVNGDGIGDVIIGAYRADNNARTSSGSAYVVFGKATTTTVDLNALGAGGFRIDGAAANDYAGWAVAGAGDVNGDGLADVIVGAYLADNNARTNSGSAYVVFGKRATAAIDLNALGAGGFRIDGAVAGDAAGYGVAGAGDVNGDGRADVIVGAYLASNNGRTNSGSAYVVFGKASASTVDLNALGAGGFRIDGAAASDWAGWTVAGAGDVNGDGRPDVIVGAYLADNNARTSSGSAYVVFGKASATSVDLNALGAGGFRIDGAAAGDNAGYAVAGAGDVNGDGRADVIVGAVGAGNNARTNSGSAYVVFGKSSTTAIDLNALGAGGFRIDGAAASDRAGYAVAGAGDVNGDGRADVIVGATGAGNNARTNSGSAYVVFGKSSTTAIDLYALGAGGFRIDGAAASDEAGYAVAGAGDVNGDGRPDVIVGAPYARNNGRTNSGSAYVVYGFGTPSVSYPGPLNATVGQAIVPLTPTVARTGQPSFTVAPVLPAGLTLDPATGVVSGTPTATEAATTHTVTMTDLAGSAQAPLQVTIAAAPPPPPGPAGPPDTTAPVVSGFAFTPKLFALGPLATPLLAKAPRGTTIRYLLSEAATTTIAIDLVQPGRKAGKKCQKQTAKNKSKRPCSRYIKQGTLTRRNQPAGATKLNFSGRLGKRALRPGAYRATIQATDAAGNHSIPKTAAFKIVKR